MRLNLREIIDIPGASLPFQCELDPARLEFPSVQRFTSPPHAEGVVRNTAGVLTLVGTLTADMICICDRCGGTFPSTKTMELEVPYEIDPEFRITAVKADHGDMAPDAIGVILEAGGWCLYFSGDTALHTDWCEKIARTYHPDIAFLSINGAFGNMNAEEGAQAADLLGVQQAVPCHFWTFTEHGGNPQQFKDLLAQHPVCRPCCMRQGEMLVLKPACAEFASTMRRSVG